MAVTKSRRTAGWTLIALLIVSLVVCLIFFFGGTNTEEVAGYKAYNQTGLLLIWTYIMIGITLLATLFFSIIGFFQLFARNKKKAMRGLLSLIAIIALLVITYIIGNGDTNSIKMLSEDSNRFLTPGWLKTTDMMIYSSVVLLILNIVAIVWSSIVGSMANKHHK